MSKLHEIELTDKELYLLWDIACWFNYPVTNTLKEKLSGLANDPIRKQFDDKYEKTMEKRIIEIAHFLESQKEKTQ